MSEVVNQYPIGLLGYSPQKILLFDNLTVREQLEYFANISGLDAQDESARMLKYFKL